MDAALLSSLGVAQALPHDLGIVLAVVPRPSAKIPSAEPTFEGGRKGIFSGESDPCSIKGGLPSVGKPLTPFVDLLPLFLAHDGWMVVGDVILVGFPVVLRPLLLAVFGPPAVLLELPSEDCGPRALVVPPEDVTDDLRLIRNDG